MEKGKAIQVPEPFAANTTHPTPQIPSFSGEGAYLWVSRVEKYFHANRTMSDEDKLRAVIGALRGTAFKWYIRQNFHLYNATPLTWPSIKKAVVQRFQPEAVNNPITVLLNIRQTGTLAEYRDLFETLIHSQPLHSPSPSPHLTLSDQLSRAIFLNGLKEDLKVQLWSREEVKSLSDLMDMGQLIEDAKGDKESMKLMRFWGEVEGKRVIIRVARGDSDSRISKRVVEELRLVVYGCNDVFVFEDGARVRSEGVCRGVLVKVHEHLEVAYDLLVFENLGGNEDVVLGFDWIRGLGTVDMDLTDLTMTFTVAGMEFTLKGNPSLTPPDQCTILRITRLITI